MKPRINIIPGAIIIGLVLAAAGGFYVWREITSPPVMQNKNLLATSPAPLALLPASGPVATPKILIAEKSLVPPHPPILNSKQKQPILWERPPGRDKLHRDREVAPTPLDNPSSHAVAEIESADVPSPPIRIEHSDAGKTIDPILLTAWQAYHNGDWDTAAQHYLDVLHKNIQNHITPDRDALLGMAAIAQQRSQDAIAAQYYAQLLALDPHDPDAHAGMSSLLGVTDAAGAESRLKLLLAQRPEIAVLHFALGNLFAEQSRWGEAEQAYFNACELESVNARFAYNFAVSLDHLGQSKLAAQHYQSALQWDSVKNSSFDHAQTQLRLNALTSH